MPIKPKAFSSAFIDGNYLKIKDENGLTIQQFSVPSNSEVLSCTASQVTYFNGSNLVIRNLDGSSQIRNAPHGYIPINERYKATHTERVVEKPVVFDTSKLDKQINAQAEQIKNLEQQLKLEKEQYRQKEEARKWREEQQAIKNIIPIFLEKIKSCKTYNEFQNFENIDIKQKISLKNRFIKEFDSIWDSVSIYYMPIEIKSYKNKIADTIDKILDKYLDIFRNIPNVPNFIKDIIVKRDGEKQILAKKILKNKQNKILNRLKSFFHKSPDTKVYGKEFKEAFQKMREDFKDPNVYKVYKEYVYPNFKILLPKQYNKNILNLSNFEIFKIAMEEFYYADPWHLMKNFDLEHIEENYQKIEEKKEQIYQEKLKKEKELKQQEFTKQKRKKIIIYSFIGVILFFIIF